MKKLSILILIFALLSACAPAPVAEAPPVEAQAPAAEAEVASEALEEVISEEPVTNENVSDEIVLQIEAGAETLSFTMADLKALPATEGVAGMKSSTGQITLPMPFKGVAVQDLIEMVGDFNEDMGVTIEAKDGYGISYDYNQITEGNFVIYDPGTGDELKAFDETLVTILAYEQDGEPISAESDGPLRVVIVGQENNQVTDGHWAVKWASKLIVKELGQDWVLELSGATVERMDRATFESGAAPGCHGTTWIDEGSQEWLGIPLWLLVGRVDDEIRHEGPAYNDEEAEAGYQIDVVASDGYTVSFTSEEITRNDDIIVAYAVDGVPLPEKHFPLRLVGSGLDKSQMVGGIARVVISIPELDPIDLTFEGMFKNALSFSKADLKSMERVTVTANDPKSGDPTEYEGVPISTLLGMALPKTRVDMIRFTASDGYAVDVDLETLSACKDCLFRIDDKDLIRLVMPGLESSYWLKDVVSVEALVSGEDTAEEESDAPAEKPMVEGGETPEATAEAGDAALSIDGAVKNPLYFSMDDLENGPMVTISAQHPKKDAPQDFTGYRINDLLLAAGIDNPDGIIMTASDGWKSEMDYATLAGCADCLVAFADDGTLMTAMPDMESSMWVKDVVNLNLK
jgi:DMSO/TMAO reductase YedYZ molybdopterin-dependent catalytic subunit